jgi:putative membrane protein
VRGRIVVAAGAVLPCNHAGAPALPWHAQTGRGDMRRTILMAVSLASLIAGPAFADLVGPDRDFATRAGQASISEVQDAQWAERNAGSQQVKDFAQMLIKDHTNASADLKRIAQQQNFSLPPLPATGQQDMRGKLKDLSGSVFDKAYLQYEIDRHQQDIAAFQQEAQTGKDEALRQFAGKYLPVLRHHLEMAQSIATKG